MNRPTARPPRAAAVDAPVTPAPVVGVDGYRRVRAATEALADPLSPEDQTVQTMPDVSPTKWHRAHVTWFWEQFVLLGSSRGYQAYDERYLYLFNSYYEGAGQRHPRAERGQLSRPGIGEVTAYRQVVDEAMVGLLERGVDDRVAHVVEIGLHHEQQHQELLLMDIKHVLGVNPLHPAYSLTGGAPSGAGRQAGWVAHDGGLVEIGRDAGDGYRWDNEGSRHRVWLERFELADRLVTAGDWLEFIDDGGYERAELWLSDGWAWVRAGDRRAPLYWDREAEGTGMVHTLAGYRPLQPAEPVVHVSYYEADAFARWSGARLPTEAEWEAVARTAPGPSETAVRLHPAPAPADGEVVQLYGSAWQWTSSSYLPYPGFEPEAGVVGEYNGKFMVGQQVLRGGACITPPGHTRASYRNFFPPSARWGFTGVRLARDA